MKFYIYNFIYKLSGDAFIHSVNIKQNMNTSFYFQVTSVGKGKTMCNSGGGFKAFAKFIILSTEHLQLHFIPFDSIHMFTMSDE